MCIDACQTILLRIESSLSGPSSERCTLRHAAFLRRTGVLVVCLAAMARAQETSAERPHYGTMFVSGFGMGMAGTVVGFVTAGALEYGVAKAFGFAGQDRLSPFGRWEPGRPEPPRARIVAEIAGVIALEPVSLAWGVHRANGRRGRFRRTLIASETAMLASFAITGLLEQTGGGDELFPIDTWMLQSVAATMTEARDMRSASSRRVAVGLSVQPRQVLASVRWSF